MRIIHLSDFHLNNNEVKDMEDIVLESLFTDLIKFNQEKAIEFIIISGDLLDKGGISFQKDTGFGFLVFEEKIVKPLIEQLTLSKDRIIFVPGNHDISRDADILVNELGLRQLLSSTQEINKKIIDNDLTGVNRIIPFKQFERLFHENFNGDYLLTDYHSCFKFEIDGNKIGIACFNTAWRCWDSENDKGQILLGERQLLEAEKFLKDTNIRIAAMHHTPDWLSNIEREFIEANIKKFYNFLFCGHAHKGDSWARTDMYGNLFVSIAPSNWTFNIRTEDKKHQNGYSVVDYDIGKSEIIISHRYYFHNRREYLPNIELGNDFGKSVLPFNNEYALKKNYELTLAKKIRDNYLEDINQHLLTYNTNTNAPKDIEKLFVFPKITHKLNYDIEEKEEITFASIEDICQSNESYILFGTKESGKTVLLDRVLLELTNDIKKYEKIGVYLDFEVFTHSRVVTHLSRYLGVNVTEIPEFLQNHKVVLLVDNLSFNEIHKNKLKILETFIQEYKDVQIIATCTQNIEREIPLGIFEHKLFVNFNLANIQPFNTKQIKELTKKWFSTSDRFDTPKKLDVLIEFLSILNLPRTPLAISMFLWILEQHENYIPINHATMLENFIEKIFEKTSKQEIYSAEFDYKNKERLLAEIAFEMYRLSLHNYRIPFNELNNFIDKYIKTKKFDILDFPSIEVLNHFLSKGILVKEFGDSEIYIRFRFNCFFQYYLMKKMDYSSDFKEFVLEEDNFLKFSNEIDYFTGLKRDQTEILRTIVKRMEKEFQGILETAKGFPYGLDTVFITKDILINKLDIKNLKGSKKPSEEELDDIKDKMLENINSDNGIEKKNDNINSLEKLEALWILAAKVLKNTEETNDGELKSECYNKILTCSIGFANLYKYLLEDYLEAKGDEIDKDIRERLSIIQRFLPLLHEELLYRLMGTGKLKVIIREKIEADSEDEGISDIEKFVSVFLYSDIRGNDFIKYIGDFIKNIKHTYISDMVLFKIVSYYYLRSRNKEMDLTYENLIADLYVRTKGLSRQGKGSLMEDFRKKKKKHLKQETKEMIASAKQG